MLSLAVDTARSATDWRPLLLSLAKLLRSKERKIPSLICLSSYIKLFNDIDAVLTELDQSRGMHALLAVI